MLNFIKKLFIHKNNSNNYHSTYSKKNQPLNNESKINNKKSLHTKELIPNEPKTSVSETKIPTNIFVNIVDENQQPLQPHLIIKTYLGSPMHIHAPAIKDYSFQKISGISSVVTIPNQLVTLHYTKKIGKPVMIYCFDFDSGQLLKTPEFITGKLETNFKLKLPQLKNYKLHLLVGNLEGHFTNEAQNVICYYRRSDWQIVQPVNYQVKISVKAKVFDLPAGKNTYNIQLPVGSIWKIFKEVKTNHELWLSLGGAEWINADNVQKITETNPKLTN